MRHPSAPADGFLRRVLPCRGALVSVILFSALVNVLFLTGSFYMLQVYDRVIPSRSLPTLVALSLLAALLYACQAVLDAVRGRILSRAAGAFDETMAPRVFDIIARAPLEVGRPASAPPVGLQPLRDVEQIRAFLAGGGPVALLDLPWVPLYLAVCFAFHPWIGFATAGGALLLVVLTVTVEVLTRRHTLAAARHAARRTDVAESGRRNAEVLAAMGMGGALRQHFEEAGGEHLRSQQAATDIASGLGSVSKAARLALQSGVLGLGACLVIAGEATAGVIIAGSILASRALAPVEQALAHWHGFVTARQGWDRLRRLMAEFPEAGERLSLRAPASSLSVEYCSVAPPSAQAFAIQDVSFTLAAGSALGVIGPTAAGKSTLARALVGAWRPVRGSVRLDGASLDQWSPEARGRHIGYLPQDVELFEGTIGQNIAKFDPAAEADDVIAAAQEAGVHDMIVRMPKGYDTPVGREGVTLSGGQRQRIGLARALFRSPFLVVLDEPNANLDAEGEAALARAVEAVKTRGGIAVVIAHRVAALTVVDHVLVLVNGQVKAFGARDEVLRPGPRPVTRQTTAPAMLGGSP